MKRVLLSLTCITTLFISACGGGSSTGGTQGASSDTFFPTGVGTTRTYKETQTQPAATASNVTETITSSTSSGNNMEITTSYTAGAHDDHITTVKYVWKNKALYASSMSDHLATTPTSTTTLNLSPEHLLLPSSFNPGTHESSAFNMTSNITFNSQPLTQSGTIDIVVNGSESVTVPAGTFQAVKMTITSTQNDTAGNGQPASASTQTDWYALGVGLVKSVSSGLTRELSYYAIAGGATGEIK